MTVYYTNTQRFKFIGLTALGTLSNFDCKLSVNTIQLLIVTYRWGNSVYNRWGCISVYELLMFTDLCLIPLNPLLTHPLVMGLNLGSNYVKAFITTAVSAV